MPAEAKQLVITPSSPTGIIGEVIRVNPGGVAYVSVPAREVLPTLVGEEFENRLVGRLEFRKGAAPAGTVAFNEIRGKIRAGKVRFIPSREAPARIATFTFDKIEGYRGESPEQMGLREGMVVEFEAGAVAGTIESVKLA